MNFLFIHQNFPGQFLHLVRHLAEDGGNRVIFISQPNANRIPNVELITYETYRSPAAGTHHYIRDLEQGVIAGQRVYEIALTLRQQGFRPDIIIGHCGWGETLYLKDVWADVPVLGYFEFFYRSKGVDVDFDPTACLTVDDPPRVRTKNAINHLSFDSSDWGLSPTRWQRSLYPHYMQERISVIHEGVNTDLISPDDEAWLQLGNGRRLTPRDEVVTYVARNLEPYRGFHMFMRALPEILKARPDAEVLIVGGDGVSYGPRLASGESFRDAMLRELGDQLDLKRVHFLGVLSYEHYLNVLRISSVHVYLTYPFVLSWSFIEAMSAGCALVASSTTPVMEVIEDGVTGLLVDFFDVPGIARKVISVLEHPDRMQALRDRARHKAVTDYDLIRVTLPQQLELISAVIDRHATGSLSVSELMPESVG